MMQRKVDNLPEEITKATRALRQEGDRRIQEERRASSKVKERCKVRNKILCPSVSVKFDLQFLKCRVNEMSSLSL